MYNFRPEQISDALMQLITDQKNGGVMAVEPGKPPYYAPPSVQ